MILAAFQIVLTYLYGESIIAIDMFINVATTNTGEVAELLGNLITAIITVICIYLPPLVWAIYLSIGHHHCKSHELITLRRTGQWLSAIGLIMLAYCWTTDERFSLRRDIFPVNVCANFINAISRTVDSANYNTTSSGYSYNAKTEHPDSIAEIYVLIIGETSRADNWQLYGYNRPTNTRLSKRKNLTVFQHTMSESNTTHKSVPMLLSPLTAETFNDSINLVKGVCVAFKEAGFKTAFISNQRRNHSYIDFFGLQADSTIFIRDSITKSNDGMLVDKMRDLLASHGKNDKILLILHSYGSHFNYRERYDGRFRVFTPDDATDANYKNRDQLINAYDNTIISTDCFIDDIIASVDSTGVLASVIYTSDHGEDIFDDYRKRFLHASPTPTFHQIHVPFLIWLSKPYIDFHPNVLLSLQKNANRQISSSRSVFPTLLQIAGISSSMIYNNASLISDLYSEPQRLYLNDYNQAVSLNDAGFREVDLNEAELYKIR